MSDIEGLLEALRADAAAALARLAEQRAAVEAARAALNTATRAYARTYRDIRAHGWASRAQLRAAGFPEPRTRARKPPPTTTTGDGGGGSTGA